MKNAGGTMTMSKPVVSRPAGIRVGGPEGKFGGSVATNFSSRGLAEFNNTPAGLKTAIGQEKASSFATPVPRRVGLGDKATEMGFGSSQAVLHETEPLKALPATPDAPVKPEVAFIKTEIKKSTTTPESIKKMPAFELPKQQNAKEKPTDSVVQKVDRSKIVNQIINEITTEYERHHATLAQKEAAKPKPTAMRIGNVSVEPITGLDNLAAQTVQKQEARKKESTSSKHYLSILVRKELQKLIEDKRKEKDGEEEDTDAQGKTRIQVKTESITQPKNEGVIVSPKNEVQAQTQMLQTADVKADAKVQTVAQVKTQPQDAVENAVRTHTQVLTENAAAAKTAYQRRIAPYTSYKGDEYSSVAPKEMDTRQIAPMAGVLGVDEVAVEVRVEQAMKGVMAVTKTNDPQEVISGADIAAHTVFTADADSEIIKEMRERRPDFSIPHVVKDLFRSWIPKVEARQALREIMLSKPPVARDASRSVTRFDVRRVLFG